MHPEVEIRGYRPGDEQQILDTFNLVFRQANGAAFVDRTMDWWRWQYLANPAGHRIVLAVAGDGTVAAQYAGVPLLADTAFGPQRFVHCVDSMTHPAWRASMPMALFVRAGGRFRAQCVELGEALCFGYPVELAYRVGREQLGYTSLATVDYLVRDHAQPPLPMPAGWHVERLTRLPDDVDALWAAVRADKRCLVRRDRRYLQWRYFDHPEARGYEVLAARRGQHLGGLLVLRPHAGLVPDGAALADWIVPEAAHDAATALLAAAVRRQRELDRRRLFAVLPPWSAEWATLVQAGFAPTPSGTWLQRRLVHDTHLAAMTPDFLATAWWHTLGDSDLV